MSKESVCGKIFIGLFLAAVGPLFLYGCTAVKSDRETMQASSATPGQASEEAEGTPWQSAEYREIELPHPEGYTEYSGWIDMAVDEENLYLLLCYGETEEERIFYLYRVPLQEGAIAASDVTALIRWGEQQEMSPEQFPDLISGTAVDYRANGGVIYLGGTDREEVEQIAPGGEQEGLEAAVRTPEGEYVLIWHEGKEYTVSRYRAQDAAAGREDRTVVIEAVYGSFDRDLKEAAAYYMKTHPGITVILRSGEFEDREAAWSRIQAELSAGAGSDMLMLYRDQYADVRGSACLADMREMLPAEMTERIYPGVLESGTADGRLCYLSLDAGTRTLFADGEAWKREDWTTDSVTGFLRESKRGFIAPADGSGGTGILQGLLLLGLEDSPFLDMDAGRCSFDSPQFRELLMLCKELGDRYSGTAANSAAGRTVDDGAVMHDVISGNVLAYEAANVDFKEYCRIRALMGENYVPVGYPAENGAEGYWVCSSGMAVNDSSTNKDVVKELLILLLERSDIYRDSFANGEVTEDWDGSRIYVLEGDPDRYPYPVKSDGTSYAEDYEAYLESCVPLSLEADDIREIIREEAEPFFNGDKDCDTVCNIIQNRVQLYLDERQK